MALTFVAALVVGYIIGGLLLSMEDTRMTLSQWLDSVKAHNFNPYAAAKTIKRAIYIPDVRNIEHSRTSLFDLSDYVVSGISGGSIILIPRADDIRPVVLGQCADCGVYHDLNAFPSHECAQQRKANRRAARKDRA